MDADSSLFIKSDMECEKEVHSKFLVRHNRVRNWRFTGAQIETLLKLVGEHSAAILRTGKVNAPINVKERRRAWIKIAAGVMAVEPKYPRTIKQVKKKWLDIKAPCLAYMKKRNPVKDTAPPYLDQIMRIYRGRKDQLSEQEDDYLEDAAENGMDLDHIICENPAQDDEAVDVKNVILLDQRTAEETNLASESQADEVSESFGIIHERFGPEEPFLFPESSSKGAATSSSNPHPRGTDQVPSSTVSLYDLYLKEEIRKSQLKQEALQKDIEMKELQKQQMELDMNLKRVKAQYYLEKTRSLLK